MSEYLVRGVALVGIDEHAWDEAVPVEGLPVYSMRMRLTGIGGGVKPATLAELLLCQVFEFAGLCR